MIVWFLSGLRRGVVTTRYPRTAPDAWTADLPTPPVFDAAALTIPIADRLVATCPAAALARRGSVLLYDVGACTACGRCAAVAPGLARPSGVFELAATHRDQLVKRIALRTRSTEKGSS